MKNNSIKNKIKSNLFFMLISFTFTLVLIGVTGNSVYYQWKEDLVKLQKTSEALRKSENNVIRLQGIQKYIDIKEAISDAEFDKMVVVNTLKELKEDQKKLSKNMKKNCQKFLPPEKLSKVQYVSTREVILGNVERNLYYSKPDNSRIIEKWEKNMYSIIMIMFIFFSFLFILFILNYIEIFKIIKANRKKSLNGPKIKDLIVDKK